MSISARTGLDSGSLLAPGDLSLLLSRPSPGRVPQPPHRRAPPLLARAARPRVRASDPGGRGRAAARGAARAARPRHEAARRPARGRSPCEMDENDMDVMVSRRRRRECLPWLPIRTSASLHAPHLTRASLLMTSALRNHVSNERLASRATQKEPTTTATLRPGAHSARASRAAPVRRRRDVPRARRARDVREPPLARGVRALALGRVDRRDARVARVRTPPARPAAAAAVRATLVGGGGCRSQRRGRRRRRRCQRRLGGARRHGRRARRCGDRRRGCVDRAAALAARPPAALGGRRAVRHGCRLLPRGEDR